MAAFDGPVRGAGTAESWRVETGYAAGQVNTDRAHPEQFTRVPRLQAAQDGQHPTDHAPGQDALVVPLQRLSVQRHHGERAAADLHGRVRGPDRQPAATERVRHRGRHHQAGRDEREEQQPDGDPLRIKPVRDPGRVGPRQPDHGEEQPGPQGARRTGMAEQVVRELGHREHVHQVEEQLHVGDALGAGPGAHQVPPRAPRHVGRPGPDGRPDDLSEGCPAVLRSRATAR